MHSIFYKRVQLDYKMSDLSLTRFYDIFYIVSIAKVILLTFLQCVKQDVYEHMNFHLWDNKIK